MGSLKAFAQSVVWAVDAFHDAPKEQLRAGKAVQLLFKENPVSIQPVSVLLMGRYNPEEHNFPEKWSDLAGAASKNLEKLFKNAKIPNLQLPHLMKQEGTSVSRCVDSFLQYALEEEADMIVVSSHARKGPVRFFMGSFAETLILHSPLPVLVLNPKTEIKKKLSHIIFPTDFSETSKVAYNRVLGLARTLNCKVLLFHKVEVMHPEFGYPFVVPPVSKESVKDLTKKYHDIGEAWVDLGRACRVDVNFYLSHKPGYALDEILKCAKRGGTTNLIAMASQSGPVKSVLLGSLTRQILRNATCPVLVIHPHQDTLVTKAVVSLKDAAYTYASRPIIT